MSEEKPTAEVHPVRMDKPWSAQAALGDAMNRTHGKPQTKLIVMWEDEHGIQHWSCANTTRSDILWMCSVRANAVLNGR